MKITNSLETPVLTPCAHLPAPVATAGDLELVEPPDPVAAERVAGYIQGIEQSLAQLRNVAPVSKADKLAEKITWVLGDDGVLRQDSKFHAVVARHLARLSDTDLDQLEKAGLRVIVVNHRVKPKGGYPGRGEDWSWQPNMRAYYDCANNDIVIPQENLESDSLLHELGHALSDVKVPDTWGPISGHEVRSKDSDPRLVGLLGDYRKRCGWSRKDDQDLWGTVTNQAEVWSHYALTHESEYLAEGVRFYLKGGADKQLLQDRDPAMFEYVKAFLGSKVEEGNWWDRLWEDENPRD